jgi:hypothetical protein
MYRKKAMLSIISIIFLLILGCSAGREVQRMDVESTIDLSGRWNDTDSRLVAEAITKDVLSHNWLPEYLVAHGKKPVVIVGTIRNKTSEHINVETFAKDIERELINSGSVRLVADPKQREEIRTERLEQQQYASEETAKRLAQELGADFMLQGNLNSIEDTIEGEKVVYYQTDLELVHLETNEKVWIGSQKIKKYITQSKYKW